MSHTEVSTEQTTDSKAVDHRLYSTHCGIDGVRSVVQRDCPDLVQKV